MILQNICLNLMVRYCYTLQYIAQVHRREMEGVVELWEEMVS